MLISQPSIHDVETIASLFDETFTHSEGAAEGLLISHLVRDIMLIPDPKDRYGFTYYGGDRLTGCIFFTRMVFNEDARTVFLLSPVAVHPEHQREGIGQSLILHGLQTLRAEGVDIVLTYGDPDYYSKTGFAVIDPSYAKPPFPLTFPHGWLAQALTDQPVNTLHGVSRCVSAFKNKDLW